MNASGREADTCLTPCFGDKKNDAVKIASAMWAMVILKVWGIS